MTTVSPDKDEVKRVARAICIALGDDPDREGDERVTAYDEVARAAIAAMSPVDRLREAGNALAESIKMNKATLVCHLPRRELGLLMDDLHKWNVAALSSPEPVGEDNE